MTDHSGHQHALAYWVIACLPWNVNSSKSMDSGLSSSAPCPQTSEPTVGQQVLNCLVYFRMADAMNDHKLRSQNKINLLSYSSGGQKFQTDLTETRIKVLAGCLSSGDLPFPASRGYLHSGMWPFPPSSKPAIVGQVFLISHHSDVDSSALLSYF